MQKVFLLGVGGQKCGTSWLHDLLVQSPQADMGFSKEYHIHDALTLPECLRFKETTLEQVRSLKAKGIAPAFGSKLHLRAGFLSQPSTYYTYFQERLSAPGITLTGDFTPSYSGLSVETLKGIATQMKAHGLHTRVVFLMRDPVERSWSALRMSRRQVSKKHPGHVFDFDEFEHLRRSYKKNTYELRANYVKTLARLDQVFPTKDIFVEFYERLFSPDVIDRICAFSGIARIDADLNKRINPSPKTSDIPEDVAAEMAQHYSDIYRGLATRFGTERIQDLWWSARFVL